MKTHLPPPRTLEELRAYMNRYASGIVVREKIGGKWNHWLAELEEKHPEVARKCRGEWERRFIEAQKKGMVWYPVRLKERDELTEEQLREEDGEP